MSRAIATVNFGNVLSDNARASFQAAAQRWDAEYVELTEKCRFGKLNPCLVKLRILELTEAERVFYIDGSDALIRGDAPSPFELCPPEAVGAVKNAWTRLSCFHDVSLQEQSEWDRLNRLLRLDLPRPTVYFNAGALVLSRQAHRALLDAAFAYTSDFRTCDGWVDQTALNYAAAEHGATFKELDETWNFVQPETVGHWDYMTRYVYHFAGDAVRRKTVLPRLRWQMPAHDWCVRRFGAASSWARYGRWRDTFLRPPSAMRVAGVARNVCRQAWWLWPVRYLYWWVTLPQRANGARNEIQALREETQRMTLTIRALETEIAALRGDRTGNGQGKEP